jgi:DNA mismatch endonuclease (patch repair protein)
MTIMPKAPRFNGFTPASPGSSEIKKRNKARNTRAELLLRKEVWRLGLRYRVHVSSLPGKPDLAFAGARLAVFCDGDFWHGRDWEVRRAKLAKGSNAKYWISKIESNISRDAIQSERLCSMGWTVLRFWEGDVLKHPTECAQRIQGLLRK